MTLERETDLSTTYSGWRISTPNKGRIQGISWGDVNRLQLWPRTAITFQQFRQSIRPCSKITEGCWNKWNPRLSFFLTKKTKLTNFRKLLKKRKRKSCVLKTCSGWFQNKASLSKQKIWELRRQLSRRNRKGMEFNQSLLPRQDQRKRAAAERVEKNSWAETRSKQGCQTRAWCGRAGGRKLH